MTDKLSWTLFGLVAAMLLDTPAIAAGANDPNPINGQQLFIERCAVCHGPNGGGGMAPALSGNTKLIDGAFVVRTIVAGGKGMPPFGSQLDDRQLTQVATYIRSSWVNKLGPVSGDVVASVRKESSASHGPDGASLSGASADTQVIGADPVQVREPSDASGPSQSELDRAGASVDSWLMYNKDYGGTRYSSLKQIHTGNAARLQAVCAFQVGETASFQSSPVIYGGLLYITTARSTIALDAKTCRLVWQNNYIPLGREVLPVNRGVAIAAGRVFRGTTDAHLLALDAKTGELLWNARPVDSTLGYFLNAAPVVHDGRVFIGTGGADWGVRGKLLAFDVKNGHQLWEFDLIDTASFGGPDAAAIGGGSSWTSYAIDIERGLLNAPVGNPSPDFAPKARPGANLYTNSVVAVDVKTGKLDHYYQQLPNDAVDRDTAAAPILFRLPKSGGARLAVGNKGGHLYVYDESTQKLLYKSAVTTIENEEAVPTAEGVHVCPGLNGGVAWHGPAFSPITGMLYVPTVDWCSSVTLAESRYVKGEVFMGGTATMDPKDKASGWIVALDAVTGKTSWRYHSKFPMVASATPTAGNVLFAGELTGDFIALNAKNGTVLYRFYTGGPIMGGISTYSIDGKQFVAVAAGGGGSRTYPFGGNHAATLFLFGLP